MKFFLKAPIALLALAGMAAMADAQRGAPDRDREEDRPAGKPRNERTGEGPAGEMRGERGRDGGHGRGHHAENFLRTHDHNRDGEVTFEEFSAAKKIENMSEEGKRRIFDHLDKDGDGKITRGELPEEGRHGAGGRNPDDKNGDGKISFEEFAASDRLPSDSTIEDRRKLFERLDSNGDGYLSAEDFRARPPGSRPWDRRRPFLDPATLEKLDENKDGSLSFEEWSQDPRFENFPVERLREWFDRLDRDEDGMLSPADRPEGPPRRGPGGDHPEGRGPDSEGPARRGPGSRSTSEPEREEP